MVVPKITIRISLCLIVDIRVWRLRALQVDALDGGGASPLCFPNYSQISTICYSGDRRLVGSGSGSNALGLQVGARVGRTAGEQPGSASGRGARQAAGASVQTLQAPNNLW